jgi:hypothetical protein
VNSHPIVADLQVTIPTDYLRKKNVLVQRGNFRPPTILTEDMLMGAAEMVFCESGTDIGGDGGTCVVQSDSRGNCMLPSAVFLKNIVIIYFFNCALARMQLQRSPPPPPPGLATV